MGKDYYLFEDERGETAFLSGVVDVLSGNLGMHCQFGNALEADIFYVKDNDMSLLNEAVKRRLQIYNDKEKLNISPEKIEKIDFHLKKSVPSSFHDTLCGWLDPFCEKDKLSEAVNEFLADLEWYLGKPLCIYSPERLPDHNIDLLGQFYLYVAWNYYFIAYNDYIVVIVIGTVE